MTDRINRAILTISACAALLLAASPALAQSGEEDEEDAATEAAAEAAAEAAMEAEKAEDDAEEDAEDDAEDDEAPADATEAEPDDAEDTPEDEAEAPSADTAAEAETADEEEAVEGDSAEASPEAAEPEPKDDAREAGAEDIEPQTEDMDEEDVTKREIQTRVAVDVNPEPTVFISGNAEAKDDEDTPVPGWRVGLTGYIRTQYTSIQDDPGTDFGRNDGFALADARLGVVGESKHGLGFKLQIDAGTAQPSDDANSPVGELDTRLTDGYIYYAPHSLLRVSAGQFKPPFDLEELISTSSILFVDRSVGSRGVRNIEGPNREGLSRTREVGLRVDSAPYYFTAEDPEDPEGIGLSYGLAVTNGQSVNKTLNDNDQLAYTGRASVHWDEYVQLGGGVYQNDRTLGTPPDQIGESRFGWTADLLVQAYGAVLFANIIQTNIDPAAELGDENSRTARAFQAQVGWRDPVIGIGPTYRFAYYDGDTDVSGDDGPRQYEALTYHTVGLIADPWDYPVRFIANYTITDEEVNPVQNNRFDALLQLAW